MQLIRRFKIQLLHLCVCLSDFLLPFSIGCSKLQLLNLTLCLSVSVSLSPPHPFYSRSPVCVSACEARGGGWVVGGEVYQWATWAINQEDV